MFVLKHNEHFATSTFGTTQLLSKAAQFESLEEAEDWKDEQIKKLKEFEVVEAV